MSAQNLRRHVYMLNQTPITLNVGDTVLYRVGIPIKVVSWGLIVTTTINSTSTAADFALDRRITPGSDTGRVEMGRMTGAVAEDYAAGKVIRDAIGTAATTSGSSTLGTQGTGLITIGGEQGHVCDVGDEIVFEVVAAADGAAGAAVPFFEYVLLGATDGDQTDAITE